MDQDSPQTDVPQPDNTTPIEPPVAAVASDSDTPTDASISAPIDSDQTSSVPTAAPDVPVAAPIVTPDPSPITTPAPVPAARSSQSVLGNKASTIDKETFIRLGHEGRRKKKEAKLERIMKEAAKRGHLNSREAAVAAEISLRTAECYLNDLVAAGRLVRHSAGNETEYVVGIN